MTTISNGTKRIELTAARGYVPRDSRSGSKIIATRVYTEKDFWQDAVNELHYWRRDPGRFFAAECAPIPEAIDDAIRYAEVHYIAVDAPTHIGPSGSGGIAFEWHSEGDELMLEFFGSGRAKWTIFGSNGATSTIWLDALSDEYIASEPGESSVRG